MTDGYGQSFSFHENIDDYDPEFEDNLDYLLDQFKRFLKACGYTEMTVSRLQYLEDEEWKYVLEQYGEWTSEHERIYPNIGKNKDDFY